MNLTYTEFAFSPLISMWGIQGY